MVNVNEPTCVFDAEKFKSFCDHNSVEFPSAYVDYLMAHNDADLEPNIIQHSENDYYVRYFYGTTGEDYSDISMTYEWYANRLPHKCVPIADPDFGNLICMSLDNKTYGKVYFWNHETMDTEDGEICSLQLEDMIFLANSFNEFLEQIIAAPLEGEDNQRKVPRFIACVRKLFGKT